MRMMEVVLFTLCVRVPASEPKGAMDMSKIGGK
jgi:hypothetical protein